jgi:transposase
MLRGGEVNRIQELKREGLSLSQISALTGFSRPTIRKYLHQPGMPIYKPRPVRKSKLDAFVPYLQQRLAAGVWNAVVLLRELRERGYSGGYSILKDYLRPLRQSASQVAVRRFETPPGHQGQVDWGDVGQIESEGHKKALSGFVMTLGHSRALFCEIATDQTLSTFLRMHEAAFQQLGGVPKEILYDRVKTVVLGMSERGEIVWHPTFLDFARYWGFTPRLCHAYRPQTKGKVESGIRYLRQSFLCGRQANDLDDLRGQLHHWLASIANRRVHGTTHQVIQDAWEAEKPFLHSIAGRPPYLYLPEQTRRVARDGYIAYQANRYSVPWTLVGQEVVVRELNGHVEIHHNGLRLAVHPLCQEKHQVITVTAHHADIPLSPSGQPLGGKTKVTIRPGAPQVEVRPLSAYEDAAGGQ